MIEPCMKYCLTRIKSTIFYFQKEPSLCLGRPCFSSSDDFFINLYIYIYI